MRRRGRRCAAHSARVVALSDGGVSRTSSSTSPTRCRTDHVGCYGARYVAHADDRRVRARRRPIRPGDRGGAVDGALDRVDDHRPLSAPARLPALGRRARSGVPDAVHGRGRLRLRDRQLRLRRELPVQRVRRHERRRAGASDSTARSRGCASAATGRSASGSTAGRRTCPTTSTCRRTASGARPRREIVAGIQSDSASALEALRESYRRAVERQSEVLFASFLERLDDLGLREQTASPSSPTTASRGASASPTRATSRAPTTCTAQGSTTRSRRCR